MINNRYKIIKQVGEGRSRVFLCEDKFFPLEKIAIKILQYTANDSEIEAFQDEYALLKKFNHPNIISAFDIGTILKLDDNYKEKYHLSENDRFMTLEWIDGVQLNECKLLSDEKILKDVIKQIVLTLHYIHQSNYIYFDLKPENILVNNNDKIKIKLIDLGLAKYAPDVKGNYLKGTSEYIAPELLKNETFDFRIDFYSLGIVLYHLAYKKFPFNNENILEVYRAQIEKEFEFPSCKYSAKLIGIIKKLLNKNPDNRYKTSFEILSDMDLNVEANEKVNLIPAISIVEREEVNNKINNFLNEETWGKIAILKGDSGSGKSSLLESFQKIYSKNVLIKTNNFTSSNNFWQQFFSRLLFQPHIYKSVDDSLIQYVSLHIDDGSDELLIELKTIISKIASSCNFVLMIDDFDKFEAHNMELFFHLFPILLANQIRIILSVSEDIDFKVSSNFEKELIILIPLEEKQIKELVEKTYYHKADKRNLKNLLISFSEKQPALILQFISDLIVTDILHFSDDGITVKYDEEKISILLTAQQKIFSVLFGNLSKPEKDVLQIISLFSVEIASNIIYEICKYNLEQVHSIVNELRIKNILQPLNQTRNANFINLGFKSFVYSQISNVEKLHAKAGQVLLKHFPDINILNKIRQFELAKDFNKANKIIDEALTQNNVTNFPQLHKTLLSKKRSFVSRKGDVIDVILNQIDIEIKLANYSEGLKLIQEIKKYMLNEEQGFIMKKYLGIILIKTGDIKEGIKLLLSIVDKTEEKSEIFLEIASGYIEINKYKQADLICEEILRNEKNNSVIIGRAQNLLGISNLYNRSDLNITLKYFLEAHKTYTQANNFIRVARSEVNLGNIQNILGNYDKAEKHWTKALQLNQSIGNVEQEANILMNTGVFYYEKGEYKKAVDLYKKAAKIFKGLGNKLNFGLVNINLGEVYLVLCEYSKALENLSIAENIFHELNNKDELIEVFFIRTRLLIALNDDELVKECFQKVSEIKSKKTEREKVLTDFIKALYKINSGNFNNIDFEELFGKLESINEKLLATDLVMIFADKNIEEGNFDLALKHLNSKKLLDVIELNSKYKAYRFFLLSRIPTKLQIDLTYTKNFLLQNAIVILKKGSITNLTIRVLDEIVRFYSERGNFMKAEEYAMLGYYIVKNILENNNHDNLDFNKLKRKYKSVLDNFEKFIEN